MTLRRFLAGRRKYKAKDRMSDKSAIEWTDATWVTITGCSRVSEGCRHCYAERLTGTRLSHNAKYAGLTRLSGREHKWTGQIRLHEDELLKPLSWRKPRRIFVNSMSDTFHEKVPFEFVDKIFRVMSLSWRHHFQILTKRPERMAEYLNEDRPNHKRIGWSANETPPRPIKWPLPNVWLGTSVEDQATADERIPHLLRCPAAVRFLSCEPLLGPIDFRKVPGFNLAGQAGVDLLRNLWVIVGGESGPGARPMRPDWARSLRDQCQAAGVPFFFKQMGARPVGVRVRDQRGHDWEGNDDLRKREFPPEPNTGVTPALEGME